MVFSFRFLVKNCSVAGDIHTGKLRKNNLICHDIEIIIYYYRQGDFFPLISHFFPTSGPEIGGLGREFFFKLYLFDITLILLLNPLFFAPVSRSLRAGCANISRPYGEPLPVVGKTFCQKGLGSLLHG